MTSLRVADQIEELQSVMFGAIDRWNIAHPHLLRSHQEHGALNVTHVFTDTTGVPSYIVSVDCSLAGTAALKFHGPDLATVAEHARLTLEHKIETELRRRADAVDHGDVGRRHAIA